ncbi:hypothetical protein [Tropicimonas sp. IMCC34043]|uniref:hypothetical protein n=1 Tax=Tropicimonas sp. IMCC34043 TaxID=2248760 RepID=UPI000E27B6EA|nr:hypothetical protein [Tropicimonas sp. IMCC34043]
MTDQELEDLEHRIKMLEELLLPEGGGGPTAIEKSFDHLKKKIDDVEGRTVTKEDLEKLKEDIDRTKRIVGYTIREATATTWTIDSMEKMFREQFGQKSPRSK